MSKTPRFNFEQGEQRSLHEFTEQAYLNYAMYVILDRALPHIADGLKPVQRRIIYAMSELGLRAGAKYKKSARTIGDVIGKFHPHGDAACYETMVLMAQGFSYRHPLIDGQGNFGSMDDPKSFAAMRYTEARLMAYTEIFLDEIDKGTTDWEVNFDGSLVEPKLLPARLPNILLNGATGIAVGMATDIPPHNLKEVVDACIYLLETPHAGTQDLCQLIKGPDFPTQAEIITPAQEIHSTYETGSGSIKMRATWGIENNNIIINALPYQSSGNKIQEQIVAQMRDKKLPMLEDLRDESDHENPTRLVLMPRSSRVDKQELMSHLFATTDLERSYRVNLNMIGTNGRPQVKNLRAILNEWLQYRLKTVKRRLQHQVDQITNRLHILQGLAIAYLQLDAIISIIREHEHPKTALIERFRLSPSQTEAILELKLRKLARLEEGKIRAELNTLERQLKSLQMILSSPQRLRTLVKKELQSDAERLDGTRKSPLIERPQAKAISNIHSNNELPADTMTIILSEKGWIRAAKGHDIDPKKLSYRDGDGLKHTTQGRRNQNVILLDATGRCYTLPIHGLPSARGLGEPVVAQLTPPDGTVFTGLLAGNDNQLVLLASDAGYGFIGRLQDLISKNKNGKSVLKPAKGAMSLPPCPVKETQQDQIAIASTSGYLLLCPINALPHLIRGKGLKIIQIPPSKLKTREDYVSAVAVIGHNDSLLLSCGQRQMTLKPSDQRPYMGKRGQRGKMLPRGFRKVSALATLG